MMAFMCWLFSFFYYRPIVEHMQVSCHGFTALVHTDCCSEWDCHLSISASQPGSCAMHAAAEQQRKMPGVYHTSNMERLSPFPSAAEPQWRFNRLKSYRRHPASPVSCNGARRSASPLPLNQGLRAMKRYIGAGREMQMDKVIHQETKKKK